MESNKKRDSKVTEIQKIVAKELKKKEEEIILEIPKDILLGDYAFPCFLLAKEKRQSPILIAKELAENLQKKNKYNDVEKIVATGPYVNFFINKKNLAAEILIEIAEKTGVKGTKKEILVKNGDINFQDLNFSFNETRKVLEDINLIINPGERVALIGPSGAGKTTFVKLLLRLYSPTSGKILIDGQDISKITQDSLRKNISMVPQDPILFHRTLSENISYGKQDATKEEIEKAAKLAHCDEFIKNLPYGLETFVGERGIKLSGGERQRVAIARAILKNAPILVLDEATSSLDSHSEMLIQDALNILMQGRTTIVIAHRLSTIQKMDRIIVFDNGKIIEEGSHNDLLNKSDSLYKKLWTLQAGGFLVHDKVEETEENNEEIQEDNDDIQEGGKMRMVNF